MNAENRKSGRIAKTAILMVIITLSAKALGMIRDILLAASYGTSPQAVAYDTASRLPLIIFDFVIGGVITASFIPIFNELLVKKSKKDALDFASSYVNIILLITALLSAFGCVFSPMLVGWLAPDIPDATAFLASYLSRIMFPMIIFTGLAFSFVGLLQSFGNFLLPAIISLVSNLIMVLYFVFLNDIFGIYGLAFAMLVGWGAQALVQLPAVIKSGFRFSFKFNFRSPYIKRSFAMALPILISSWVQPFCNLINTRFASSIEGGISAMGYANRLYLIIVGVFTFVATNLLFPYFSKAKAGGDREEESRLTRTSLKTLMLVILPIASGIVALSEPIIAVIYGRGEFNSNDIFMTANALRFFTLGMPFYAINEVCTKKFFAEQKTLPPMITALVAIAFNIAFAALLSEKMGISGIALSSSLAVMLNSLLNMIVRYCKGDRMIYFSDAVSIITMLVSSAAMGSAVWYLKRYLPFNIVGLAANIMVGAVLYFLICFVMKEQMTHTAVNKIFRRKEEH
ncbi:MAG: murein biosynthesis integral membrane protein MurJ [Clostridia bacterium]|nr:murein biosynthesis integral membrane protein MurJ [Clostridia bacterium]